MKEENKQVQLNGIVGGAYSSAVKLWAESYMCIRVYTVELLEHGWSLSQSTFVCTHVSELLKIPLG